VTTVALCCGASYGKDCTAKVLIYFFVTAPCSSEIHHSVLIILSCDAHLVRCVFPSAVCKMNVHIRCKGNVAPNCGVNNVELANKLAEMGLQPGGMTKRNSMVCLHTCTQCFRKCICDLSVNRSVYCALMTSHILLLCISHGCMQ